MWARWKSDKIKVVRQIQHTHTHTFHRNTQWAQLMRDGLWTQKRPCNKITPVCCEFIGGFLYGVPHLIHSMSAGNDHYVIHQLETASFHPWPSFHNQLQINARIIHTSVRLVERKKKMYRFNSRLQLAVPSMLV